MVRYPGGISGIMIPGPVPVPLLVGLGSWEQVGNTITDRVCHAAPGTCQCPFNNPGFIFLQDLQCKVTFTDRAAQDIKQASLHGVSRRSIICDTSGPVEIRVIGAPMSASAFFRKLIAFSVSCSYRVAPKHASSILSIPVIAA